MNRREALKKIGEAGIAVGVVSGIACDLVPDLGTGPTKKDSDLADFYGGLVTEFNPHHIEPGEVVREFSFHGLTLAKSLVGKPLSVTKELRHGDLPTVIELSPFDHLDHWAEFSSGAGARSCLRVGLGDFMPATPRERLDFVYTLRYWKGTTYFPQMSALECRVYYRIDQIQWYTRSGGKWSPVYQINLVWR